MSIRVEKRDLHSTQKKMIQVANDLSKEGGAVVRGVAKSTLIAQRGAMKAAPVDRGIGRASITPDVVVRDNVVRGVVGSNKAHMAAQETGTRPFWPPWRPLFEWARRKMRGNLRLAGALAAGARRAIARKGIKAKRYLQTAFEDNADRIRRILERAVNKSVEK